LDKVELSTQQNGATYSRTPFPNNIIPRERMDAPAATLAQLYPQPTTSALANNFVWSPVRPQNINQVDSRLDQQIGRGNLFGRYSWGHTSTTNPVYLPGKAQGAAGFSGPNGLNTQGAAAGYTYTFRPNLVSETRLGFTRLKRQVFPFFYGENLSQQVGIPNAQQDVFSSGLSTISISGFRGLGDASFLPIYQVENGYQVTENMNWTRGRHILKIGGQMIRPQIEQFQSANPAGLFHLEDYAESIKAARWALRLDPNYNPAHFILGATPAIDKRTMAESVPHLERAARTIMSAKAILVIVEKVLSHD